MKELFVSRHEKDPDGRTYAYFQMAGDEYRIDVTGIVEEILAEKESDPTPGIFTVDKVIRRK
jgi:hypothetical protein